jgi:spermidine dehydrogenase
MVYTPIPFGEDPSMDGRTLARMGRGTLLGMSFEDHEQMIRDQLTELLSPYGFDAGTDILAITVNRWSHGYSWSYNSLYEDEADAEATISRAREARGNVAIANSDSDWAPYVPGAVSQAWRAVAEVTAS